MSCQQLPLFLRILSLTILGLAGLAVGASRQLAVGSWQSAGQADDAKVEAELKQLALRAAQTGGDPEKLRLDLRAVQLRYPGSVHAVRASGLLRDLNSSLDLLDAKTIPALERFDWQPKELVAILGEHRGRHAGVVTSVVYSRNGKWLVSGGSHGSIRIWDPATMRLQHHLGHSSGSLSLSISKDNTLLASGGGDGHVRLWDLSDGKPKDKATFKVASTPLYSVALSPNGKLLAIGGGDNRMYLWDLGADPPKETTAGDVHTSAVMAVAFSADGKTIASASQDKTVRLWTVLKDNRAKDRAVMEGHTAGVLALAYHPSDDKILVSGSADGVIRFWNVGGTKPLPKQIMKSAGGAVHGLAFSLSGKTLGSANADGTGRTWSVAPAVQEKAILQGHIAAATSIAFAPDGQSIATGSHDWTVRTWPGISGPKPKDRTVTRGHLSHVYTVAFAPDGKSLASGSYDRSLRFWDLVASEPKERLPNIKPESIIYTLAFAPDGKTVAAGGASANFRIYDVLSRKFLNTFSGHTGQISRLEFSPDGNLVLSCSNDKTMRLWNPATGKDVHIFNDYEAAVHACTFAPDGKHLASTSGSYLVDKKGHIIYKDGHPLFLDSTVRLYEVDSKKEQFRWKDEKVLPSPLGISADSRRLFVGANDAVVRAWELPKPKTADPAIFYKGTHGVGPLAFTPDGKWMASFGPDYRLTLWDLAAGKKVKDWVLHEQFGALALSPDSRHLAVSLGTGVIYVLRLAEPGRTLLIPTEKK